MKFCLERTQDAVSRLGVHAPQPGGDARHQKDVDYAFCDYQDSGISNEATATGNIPQFN